MEQQRQKVLAELQEKETQAKELDEEKARLAKTTASLKEDIDVSVHGRCGRREVCEVGSVEVGGV